MSDCEMAYTGLCYVGRHVTRSDYILLRFGTDPRTGTHFGVGPVVSLSNEEMERKGLGEVIKAIRDSPAKGRALAEMPGDIPLEELLRIKRKHTIVDVGLYEGWGRSELRMSPMHAGRGWHFMEWPEELVVLPLPASNAEFKRALDEALEVAS